MECSWAGVGGHGSYQAALSPGLGPRSVRCGDDWRRAVAAGRKEHSLYCGGGRERARGGGFQRGGGESRGTNAPPPLLPPGGIFVLPRPARAPPPRPAVLGVGPVG